MRNLSVRHRIIGCFMLILAVTAIMGGVAFDRFTRVSAQAVGIQRQAMPGLSLSLQLMGAWEDEYALMEAHILENTPDAIKAAQAAIDAHHGVLSDLMAQYEASESQNADLSDQARQAFNQVKLLSTRYMAQEATTLVFSTANQDEQARDQTKSQMKPLFTQIQANLQLLVDANKANADVATADIVSSVNTARLSIVISFIVAVLIALIGGYLLFRQVLRTGVQVSTSITEIAATSKQQQATATEIAATTTEIGITAKEISATSHELGRTMAGVSSVAEQTAALAGGGQAGLVRMEDAMRQVVAASAAINTKLGTLNEKASNINQVVTTITKVADQTNLLSLNAAIEAEKAGEHGRGFAVVATEIRRLADQTAVSTYDIEQMVRDIQSAAAAGVMGMDKFSEEVRRGMAEMQHVGGQLSEIIRQVQGLAPQVESVNEGMQAQATGAEQISQALTQLSEAAQQTVESLHQTTIAMDDLNRASNSLHGAGPRLKRYG